MKKIYFATSLLLVLGVFLFNQFVENDAVTKKDENNNTSQNLAQPQLSNKPKKITLIKKSLAEEKQVVGMSAAKKKFTKPDLLSGFSRQEINFFKDSIYLVEGVFASLDLRKGTEPITQLAGFYIYDTPGEKNHQVVFSPSRGSYGIFSGEIILNGQFQSALNFLEKTSFEVLYQNDVTQKIIIRIDNIGELSSLEDIKSSPGLSISPDLKFSRVKSLNFI